MTLALTAINVTSQQQNTQAKNVTVGKIGDGTTGSENGQQMRVQITSSSDYKQDVRKRLDKRIGHQATREWVRNNTNRPVHMRCGRRITTKVKN